MLAYRVHSFNLFFGSIGSNAVSNFIVLGKQHSDRLHKAKRPFFLNCIVTYFKEQANSATGLART